VYHLFVVTAVFETATAALLLLVPAVVFVLLFGWSQVGSEMALIGRVAGAAMLGLSVASWLARGDRGAPAIA
jgi:hypothetical protein